MLRNEVSDYKESISTGDGPRIDNAIDKMRAACRASGEPWRPWRHE